MFEDDFPFPPVGYGEHKNIWNHHLQKYCIGLGGYYATYHPRPFSGVKYTCLSWTKKIRRQPMSEFFFYLAKKQIQTYCLVFHF